MKEKNQRGVHDPFAGQATGLNCNGDKQYINCPKKDMVQPALQYKSIKGSGERFSLKHRQGYLLLRNTRSISTPQFSSVLAFFTVAP